MDELTHNVREHDWFYYAPVKAECCRQCGVIRRLDGRNGACRGPVKISRRIVHPEVS